MEIATVFIGAFDLVSTSLVHATQGVTRFSSELNRLKETISSIKDAIDDIGNSNNILLGCRSQRDTELFTLRLVEGEKLIRKCSKVKRWNVFKRWYYSKKLIHFETLLLNFFKVDVVVYQLRETKRLSVMVITMDEMMNEITKLLTNLQNVNGFEQSWQREKEITCILEDGGNAVEFSATGESSYEE